MRVAQTLTDAFGGGYRRRGISETEALCPMRGWAVWQPGFMPPGICVARRIVHVKVGVTTGREAGLTLGEQQAGISSERAQSNAYDVAHNLRSYWRWSPSAVCNGAMGGVSQRLRDSAHRCAYLERPMCAAGDTKTVSQAAAMQVCTLAPGMFSPRATVAAEQGCRGRGREWHPRWQRARAWLLYPVSQWVIVS